MKTVPKVILLLIDDLSSSMLLRTESCITKKRVQLRYSFLRMFVRVLCTRVDCDVLIQTMEVSGKTVVLPLNTCLIRSLSITETLLWINCHSLSHFDIGAIFKEHMIQMTMTVLMFFRSEQRIVVRKNMLQSFIGCQI